MLLATGKQSADADKRVCDKNNSLSKASSQEYPKYQYPFLLDIVFLHSAFYCPFIVKKHKQNQSAIPREICFDIKGIFLSPLRSLSSDFKVIQSRGKPGIGDISDAASFAHVPLGLRGAVQGHFLHYSHPFWFRFYKGNS